jgi:hypothetical protein
MGEGEQEAKPPVPNYIALRDDAAVRERENGRRWAGTWMTAGAVMGTVFIWIGSNLQIHPVRGRPVPVDYFGPTLVTLAAAAVIGGIGIWYWKREGSKAFLIGTLIGLGVGALIEGTCFVILISR